MLWAVVDWLVATGLLLVCAALVYGAIYESYVPPPRDNANHEKNETAATKSKRKHTTSLRNAQPLASRKPTRLSQYGGLSNDVAHAETQKRSPSMPHARVSVFQSGSVRAPGLHSASSSAAEREGHSSVTNRYNLGWLLRSGGQEPLFTVSSAAERNRAQTLDKATR